MVYPKQESDSGQASLSQSSTIVDAINEQNTAAHSSQCFNSLLMQEVEMKDSCDPLVLVKNEESSIASYEDNLIELDMSVTTKPFEDVIVSGGPEHRGRLTSEEMLSQWTYYRVLTKLGTHYQCLQFAIERGLIPKIKMCSKHRKPMSVSEKTDGLGSFRCFKRACRMTKVSRAKGTFFENCHLDLTLVFQLMYLYSHNFTNEQARHETACDEKGTVLSTTTIVDWFTFFRDTIVTYETEHQSTQGKIGGPNKIVHIGQSKYANRKRIRGKKNKQNWVIGMFEEGSKDLRLKTFPPGIEICTENLVPVVKKHVHEGSIIRANFSKPYYSSLSEHGFVCKQIINKSNECKSDNMERNGTKSSSKSFDGDWGRLGKAYKNDPHVESFSDWMVVNMWRHKIKTLRKDPFEELLSIIKYVYNPNTTYV